MKTICEERERDCMAMGLAVSDRIHEGIRRACNTVRGKLQDIQYDLSTPDGLEKSLVYVMEHYDELREILSEEDLQTYLYYYGGEAGLTGSDQLPDDLKEKAIDFLHLRCEETGEPIIATKWEYYREDVAMAVESYKRGLEDIY
jgi:hypothetical protein